MSAGDMRDYRWYRSLGWSVPDALAAVRNPELFAAYTIVCADAARIHRCVY